MRTAIAIAASTVLLGITFSAQAGRDEAQLRQQDKANKEAVARRQQQMSCPTVNPAFAGGNGVQIRQ